MSLADEQQKMRERMGKGSPRAKKTPASPHKVRKIKPEVLYVTQDDADKRYREKIVSRAEQKKELMDELRYPSSEALAVRLELKQRAIALKGGSCYLCGYKRCARALEFHHLERQNKSFTISSFIANAVGYFLKKGRLLPAEIEKIWESVVWELRKCVLLCANCHREVEGGIAELKGQDGA
jgi:hypothetical protein